MTLMASVTFTLSVRLLTHSGIDTHTFSPVSYPRTQSQILLLLPDTPGRRGSTRALSAACACEKDNDRLEVYSSVQWGDTTCTCNGCSSVRVSYVHAVRVRGLCTRTAADYSSLLHSTICTLVALLSTLRRDGRVYRLNRCCKCTWECSDTSSAQMLKYYLKDITSECFKTEHVVLLALRCRQQRFCRQ